MLWYSSSALTGSPSSDLPSSSCLAAMLCASWSSFSPLLSPWPGTHESQSTSSLTCSYYWVFLCFLLVIQVQLFHSWNQKGSEQITKQGMKFKVSFTTPGRSQPALVGRPCALWLNDLVAAEGATFPFHFSLIDFFGKYFSRLCKSRAPEARACSTKLVTIHHKKSPLLRSNRCSFMADCCSFTKSNALCTNAIPTQ